MTEHDKIHSWIDLYGCFTVLTIFYYI
jgi:hypothetical protein